MSDIMMPWIDLGNDLWINISQIQYVYKNFPNQLLIVFNSHSSFGAVGIEGEQITVFKKAIEQAVNSGFICNLSSRIKT